MSIDTESNKNVLVIAAHPDDEILGLGGTIRKLVNDNYNISCVILGEGLTSRKDSRIDTPKNQLMELKDNTLKSANIVGYSNVEFCELPDNRFDSVDLLDVIKIVTKQVEKYKPDTIFTHHYSDLNIDHRITFEAVTTCCRPVGNYVTKNIICFETPSSTEWNFKNSESYFKPNLFIDITQTIKYKLDAMSCYITEIKEYPHPRSLEALRIIAARWGTVVGTEYAEAFEIVRSVR
ncbi:PIG-L family deacetylase [Ruminiclostridium herbifermentans]|uniref:PIG-L family deacetylase n=2 Tax=Ruminiclostridium herbifermentans TaxID=2488810 RepID=A0A4U7JH51_9FIRM|nr:PIG-L family deacetylase [Ruminiclostridium herbifermentans]